MKLNRFRGTPRCILLSIIGTVFLSALLMVPSVHSFATSIFCESTRCIGLPIIQSTATFGVAPTRTCDRSCSATRSRQRQVRLGGTPTTQVGYDEFTMTQRTVAEDAASRARERTDSLRTTAKFEDYFTNANATSPTNITATWLKQRLRLSNAKLQRMIQRHPQITRYHIENNLEPKLSYLESRLSMTPSQLSARVIQRAPQILGLSLDDNIIPTTRWLETKLDLSDAQMCRIITTFPAVLGYDPDSNLNLKIQYLQRRLDLDDDQLRKIVIARPSLFGFSSHENLEVTILWLEKIMRSDSATSNAMDSNASTCARTSVSGRNGGGTFNTAATYTNSEQHGGRAGRFMGNGGGTDANGSHGNTIRGRGIGGANHDASNNAANPQFSQASTKVRKIILRSPTILGLSVETNLQPKIDHLQQRLDMTTSELTAIIAVRPAIFTVGIETSIDPTLDWLQDAFHLESKADLAFMVRRLPTIFGLSIDNNLQPTFDFYTQCLGGDRTAAVAMLRKDASLFSFSVRKRLRPRLAQVMEEAGCSSAYDDSSGDSDGSGSDGSESDDGSDRDDANGNLDHGLPALTEKQTLRLARTPPALWDASLQSGRFFR